MRRTIILGRWVLRGLDETWRLPKQFKAVVVVLRPKRMVLKRKREYWDEGSSESKRKTSL